MRIPISRAATALALAALAACSSSDSAGTEVAGLDTPSQLSIVTASADQAGAGGSVTAGAGATDFPDGSDYDTDTADVWVFDPSVEPISMVNEILCMLSQTRAGAMVNLGPYIAQIDTTRCSQGSEGGGDSGQSSGNTTEFEFWTVESSRNGNGAPQTVHVWVPNEEEGVEGTIFVEATVTEGISAANPFGVFSMNFAAAPTFADVGDPMFLGTLSTTDPASGMGFTFYNEFAIDLPDEQVEETVAVNVNMTADQAEGVARVYRDFDATFGSDSFQEQQEFSIAFDETHLLRAEGDDEPVCLSREDFDTQVWRYNLYHADGENLGGRVELNSGFGFRTEEDDYGWIGYYGMWTPEGVEVEHGDVVTEDVYGDDDPAEYTIFQAPGRLIRYSREEVSLADIVGESFEYWEWDDQSGQGVNYRISFDGAVWTKVAVLDEQTGEWDPIDPPLALNLQNGDWLGLWSPSLGGSVDYVHGDACGCVTVYVEEFVTPSDDVFTGVDEVTFYGYSEMLDSEISQQDAEAGDVYLPEVQDVGSPYAFTFDVATMTLLDAGEAPVGLAEGVEPEHGPNTWGMRTGPMLLDTSGLQNTWELFSQDVYYVYETGHNEWNRYTAAVDVNGETVTFDPPLQFSYQHTIENDRNGDDAHDGGIYFLNYDGPGQLWGIPHEGVDLDGDMEPDRWYPVFSMEDGVLMGPTGAEYVVKAVEMEQTLALAPGECGDLDLSTAEGLELPTAAGFETPEIGSQPAVSDPPAVVNGKVQTAE